ncbi:MAG TPA: Wzz/FepE/Etk N-terminal domain-containing protein [Albidovulum sp.]|uniref:GumC family protein n=1 Tax=Albidovulum sp. TaxID=1872424 RepID=UPI002B545F49|nr:Wzz/FepE/Etk N-terminal domain-containing protein [Albidovulum sp.]
MNLDLSFYLAVFLRRIHYFILVFALVSAAAVAAAFLLPAVYTARATLIVEGSQIPGPLQPPSVQAQAMEKLQVAEKNLMRRVNLLDIAQKLEAFANYKSMTPDQVVKAMVDNTRIEKSAGRGEATIMTITFDGETGAKAAAVVNEYVTILLSEDAQTRKKIAEDSVSFFAADVKRLDAELSAMSAKILKFQEENKDALPNTLSYRLGQQQILQDRLAATERDIALLKDQKDKMIALFEATGQITGVAAAAQTPEAQQLAQLRQTLNTSLAVLSPANPKIKQLQAQIGQLEKVVQAQQVPVAGATGVPMSPIDVQIASMDAQKQGLETQRKQLMEQLDILKDSIDRTPANDVALASMTRDNNNIQQQYNTAVAKQAAASSSEQVELLSKGERLNVVEAASAPDTPTKPNRVMIAGGGIAAGAGLGFALVVLLELLNRSVRRPKDLVSNFGITPLATIPYLRTPSETMRRRSGFVALLLVAVVGIPAAIYAVHVYVAPLDYIFNKVAEKIGTML